MQYFFFFIGREGSILNFFLLLFFLRDALTSSQLKTAIPPTITRETKIGIISKLIIFLSINHFLLRFFFIFLFFIFIQLFYSIVRSLIKPLPKQEEQQNKAAKNTILKSNFPSCSQNLFSFSLFIYLFIYFIYYYFIFDFWLTRLLSRN